MDLRLREAERAYLRNPGPDTAQALRVEWKRLVGEGHYEHPLLPDARRDAAEARALCNRLVQEHGTWVRAISSGADLVTWKDDLVSVTWTRVSTFPNEVEPTMDAFVRLPGSGLVKIGGYRASTASGPDREAEPEIPRVLEHLRGVVDALEGARKAAT